MSEEKPDYNLSGLFSEEKKLRDATPQELFDALKRKTSAVIVAWIEPCADNVDFYNAQYGGSWATAIGLSRYFEEWVNGRFPSGTVEDE